MTYIIAAIFVGTVSFAVGQSWLMRQLRNQYKRSAAPWPSDKSWPKAAIVLSLRGKDPFLENCLRNLIRQDYPDFILQIVVDSATDPAWEAINAVRAECDDERLHVSVLYDRRSSCSLKNSSIIQAVRSLPDDCEVVAFVDADAVTEPAWLRNLVTPLADATVGCSTGIRWFAPIEDTFATRLRCYWNLVAASVIYQSSTPWGGSMVVRRSVLDSGLTEEWSRMFCEDAHTINHLQRRGLKLVCVPEATVVNEESTTVSGCVKFVNRQMLIFKLYHKQWWSVVAMIAFAVVLRFTHIHFIFQSLFHGEWINLLVLLCIHPIIFFAARYESVRLDQAVQEMVGRTGRKITRTPVPEFVGYFCAEVMSLASMVYAMGARQVQWRGIDYKVAGPVDITLLAYHPYVEVPAFATTNTTTVI